ncbi:MAG: endonuclease/exonuclease/phosphatase family protein [Planctomycetota bacterium]
MHKDLSAAGLVHWRRFPSGLVGSGLHISSRFPIREASFLRYACGGQPWKVRHGDFYGGKGIARVRVETLLGPLDVACTHMHAVYKDEKEYLATRTAEALEAAEFLVEKDGVPLVLGADLNATKGSLPFELFAHGAGLTELPAEDRIDWVIARSGAAVRARITSYERALTGPVALSDGQTRPLSDHEARLAVVTLEPPSRRARRAPSSTRGRRSRSGPSSWPSSGARSPRARPARKPASKMASAGSTRRPYSLPTNTLRKPGEAFESLFVVDGAILHYVPGERE